MREVFVDTASAKLASRPKLYEPSSQTPNTVTSPMFLTGQFAARDVGAQPRQRLAIGTRRLSLSPSWRVQPR